MSRDESRYPEPEKFKPERFLTVDGKFNLDPNDPCGFVFGFGRRSSYFQSFSISNSTYQILLEDVLVSISQCQQYG